MNREPRPIAGLGAIADSFDHVVLDQWGVLHKGERVFPAALDCIGRVRRAGKSVVILSNSGKRSAGNAHRLADLGLPHSQYDALLSSGELAWLALKERRTAPYDRLGPRCFLITRGDDRSVIDGLPYALVDRIEAADFVLISGADEDNSAPETWRPVLAEGAARGLPLICANPDLTMIAPGRLLPGPGGLARLYESLGGSVTYIGKPHVGIYAACLKLLGSSPPSRVLAVGDSLDHDILGANRAGMGAALVTGGVHAPAFATSRTLPEIVATIKRLTDKADALPQWVMPVLTW